MNAKKKSKKVDILEHQLESSQSSLQKEKNKLKKQIEELRSIILELECDLDLCAFKDVKFDKPIVADTSVELDVSQISDVNVNLETELFRFAGFRCLKFTKQEFVFNLSPLNKYDKEVIFFVQLLCKNSSWTLGKWTMPMTINLKDLVGQFSKDIRDIPNFIRTCKHYIDCYYLRRKQYNALKEIISCTKNSSLQTSDGYTHMMLHLMGIHDVEHDKYINVVIYIEYNVDEVRPNKIDIDSQDKQELNTKVKQQLKSFVKCFKSFDLNIAFEKLWNDGTFTWTKEADEDSPLEINNSDSSEEESYLENLLSQNRKKRKRKRNLHVSRNVERNNESLALQKQKENMQNSSQHSINENENETGTSSNVHKLDQKKLKQAKLNFEPTKHSHKNLGTSKKSMTPKKNVLRRNLDKVITSTPMRQSIPIVMETDILDNISDIVNEEQNSKTKSIKKRKLNKLNKK